MNNINKILVTIDGDFVCNEHCKTEYEKQKDYFFNVMVHNERLVEDYLTKG